MRLGILEFGLGAETTTLVEPLHAQDIDIVVGDEPLTSGTIAAREVARLGRADCDGVVLYVADDSARHFVAQASLYFTCPLLLVGRSVSVMSDAAGALAVVGVPFDRFLIDDEETAHTVIADWLRANRKTERQPGQEAAQKLYGLRLAVPATPLVPVDASLWLQQFGIMIVPAGEEAEIQADDGDTHTALCAHLLGLIAGTEPQVVSVDTPLPAEHTFAQIARRSGRFVCLYGYDAASPAVAPLPLLSSKLVVIPGDRRTALKAACHSLDIAL